MFDYNKHHYPGSLNTCKTLLINLHSFNDILFVYFKKLKEFAKIVILHSLLNELQVVIEDFFIHFLVTDINLRIFKCDNNKFKVGLSKEKEEKRINFQLSSFEWNLMQCRENERTKEYLHAMKVLLNSLTRSKLKKQNVHQQNI